ncbi:MAG TPA: hypothetical protein VF773_13285 [Verrucomicrobiae bacterium]
MGISRDANAESAKVVFQEPSTLKVSGERFDLVSANGVARFREMAGRAIEGKKLSSKDQRGLREILRIIGSDPSGYLRDSMRQQQVFEVAAAIANSHRPQVPRYVGLPDLPFRFVDSLSNPVGKGSRPARNLAMNFRGDFSMADPESSTFWRRPDCIASQDLGAGFGRESVPAYDGMIWSYREAKKNGGNPGCELVAGSHAIKVKFAETHAEPFAARIFHALGYYVEETDFVAGLKMRYDRRFFTEFNSRPEMTMKIGLFFIPIHTFHFEDDYDPFDYIARVVLKNGSVHEGRVLKKLLLRDAGRKNAWLDGSNYTARIEEEIDYLVTVEANVQPKDPRVKTIGSWDFGGLGHEDLRELRGAGVLAGWLGWWDSRFENTRLRVVETETGPQLRHYFSDLGATLGRAEGTYHHSCEDAANFAEIFTRSRYLRGEDRWKVEFPNFEPIEDTLAFERITFTDARWMARLIGQLTEKQIVEALAASGFSAEEVRIYSAKLFSRRNQLIRDTQLRSEFRMLEFRAMEAASEDQLTIRE